MFLNLIKGDREHHSTHFSNASTNSMTNKKITKHINMNKSEKVHSKFQLAVHIFSKSSFKYPTGLMLQI